MLELSKEPAYLGEDSDILVSGCKTKLGAWRKMKKFHELTTGVSLDDTNLTINDIGIYYLRLSSAEEIEKYDSDWLVSPIEKEGSLPIWTLAF